MRGKRRMKTRRRSRDWRRSLYLSQAGDVQALPVLHR